MRKILNGEQENWLYANYSDKTNKELAEELTAMVKAENQKHAKRLSGLLEGITDPAIQKAVKRNIASLLMFESVSEDYVRKYARKLNCPPKSAALRSETARQKAASTNIKLWLSKAVTVDSPMDWFRTFFLHETKVCLVKDVKEMKSIRTAMSRWNRQEGFDKGIFLTSTFVTEANILRVEATINRASGII